MQHHLVPLGPGAGDGSLFLAEPRRHGPLGQQPHGVGPEPGRLPGALGLRFPGSRALPEQGVRRRLHRPHEESAHLRVQATPHHVHPVAPGKDRETAAFVPPLLQLLLRGPAPDAVGPDQPLQLGGGASPGRAQVDPRAVVEPVGGRVDPGRQDDDLLFQIFQGVHVLEGVPGGGIGAGRRIGDRGINDGLSIGRSPLPDHERAIGAKGRGAKNRGMSGEADHGADLLFHSGTEHTPKDHRGFFGALRGLETAEAALPGRERVG